MTGALLLVACTAACGSYNQRIRGTLRENGEPLPSLPVRFISAQPEGSCEVGGLEAVTDSTGQFEMSQLYERSFVENVAVVNHPYRLCVKRNGTWAMIWHETTGPAPSSLELQCVLDKSVPCEASWNGQASR